MEVSLGVLSALLVVFCGTFSVVLADKSFKKRVVTLGDEPTLPRYLTNKRLYWAGDIAYCAAILLLYALLVVFWFPLQPLLAPLFKYIDLPFLVASEETGSRDDVGSAIAVVASAGVVLFLTYYESKYNPLLIIREFIHDIVSIPKRAQRVYETMIGSLYRTKSDDDIKNIMASGYSAALTKGDFGKGFSTIEYKWAHTCHLIYRASLCAKDDALFHFFSEESLKWNDIQKTYAELGEKVGKWKKRKANYVESVKVLGEIDSLTTKLCRLLSCTFVYSFNSDKEMWKAIKNIGANVDEEFSSYNINYLIVFGISTILSILAGREIAIFSVKLFINPVTDLQNFNISETFTWLVFGVSMFTVPILPVLLYRSKWGRMQRRTSERRWEVYFGFGLLGVVASALILIMGYGLNIERLGSQLLWSVLPGFVAGFVSYQMDTDVSEDGTRGAFVLGAIKRSLICCTIGFFALMYASSHSELSADQTFVVVSTGILVSAMIGAMAVFPTKKEEL